MKNIWNQPLISMQKNAREDGRSKKHVAEGQTLGYI